MEVYPAPSHHPTTPASVCLWSFEQGQRLEATKKTSAIPSCQRIKVQLQRREQTQSQSSDDQISMCVKEPNSSEWTNSRISCAEECRIYVHAGLVGSLVVLDLTALSDSISVYIGPSPKEREKEKRKDRGE